MKGFTRIEKKENLALKSTFIIITGNKDNKDQGRDLTLTKVNAIKKPQMGAVLPLFRTRKSKDLKLGEHTQFDIYQLNVRI